MAVDGRRQVYQPHFKYPGIREMAVQWQARAGRFVPPAVSMKWCHLPETLVIA